MIKLIHFSWQDTCRIEKNRLFRSRGQDSAIILEWEGGMPSLLFWPRYHSVERLVYNPATDSLFRGQPGRLLQDDVLFRERYGAAFHPA